VSLSVVDVCISLGFGVVGEEVEFDVYGYRSIGIPFFVGKD